MASAGRWIIVFLLVNHAYGQGATEPKLPTFGDVVPILGAMERTDQDFQDGLALDLFSPKNRTIQVQQNKSPLPAQFMSGANGEPFVALSNYSYILQMNETANDLIAKIELPYDPVILNAMGVQEANTYVARLSGDKRSWIVDDQQRNVHRSENNTRIIKMTSMDGEYLLVGRKTADTANIFVQYGQGETRTVNLTGGLGVQQAEFVDGLRFAVQAESAMRMNVDLNEGVNPGTLPANTQALNSYSWVVNTTKPQANVVGEIRFPFNRMMLAALRPQGSSPTTMLTVAKRPLNATSGTYMPINSETQAVSELLEDRIVVPGMTQLDGQYIILVTAPKDAPPPAAETTLAPQMASGSMNRRWTGPEEAEARYILKYLASRDLDASDVAAAMNLYISTALKTTKTSHGVMTLVGESWTVLAVVLALTAIILVL